MRLPYRGKYLRTSRCQSCGRACTCFQRATPSFPPLFLFERFPQTPHRPSTVCSGDFCRPSQQCRTPLQGKRLLPRSSTAEPCAQHREIPDGPALRCRNCLQGGASRGGTGRRCSSEPEQISNHPGGTPILAQQRTPNLTTRQFQDSWVDGPPLSLDSLCPPSLLVLKQSTTTKHKGPSQKVDWTSIEIGAQLLVGCGRARARNRGGWVDSRDLERDLGAMQRGGGGSSGSVGNTRHSTAAFFKVLPETRSPLL